MRFGFYHGPESFQHYINDTLEKYLDIFCISYFNQILIYSNKKLEHEVYIKNVLSRFWDAVLQVDIIKSMFYITEIAYFRPMVTIKRVQMDPTKVDTIFN